MVFRAKWLLAFVFAFSQSFEHCESGFFGIAKGNRFGVSWGVDLRDDFSDGPTAEGTCRQCGPFYRSVKSEFAIAHLAIAFTKFVFIEWHGIKSGILWDFVGRKNLGSFPS